jgi:hypothetical protein
MKTEIEKFTKIIEIFGEMYDINSKYCIDCFFNMYYQFRRKVIVEERCNYNDELIRKVWGAINRYDFLTDQKHEAKDKAVAICLNTFNIDGQLFNSILRSFEATKGTKKTKFKDLC